MLLGAPLPSFRVCSHGARQTCCTAEGLYRVSVTFLQVLLWLLNYGLWTLVPEQGVLLVFSLHTFAKHLSFVKCVVCVIEVK